MGLPFETRAPRRGVLTPGLALPPGVERHPVPGGGSRAVEIRAGDEITVTDREGGQLAEIVAFTPSGAGDAGLIGAVASGAPEGLLATLRDSVSGRGVARALAAAGFDLGAARAVRRFGEGSRPGDSAQFTAGGDGLLVVAAPGGPMAPDAQDAPTELLLYIRRADRRNFKGAHPPPDPLADPLTDRNIRPGEAFVYEVPKGGFIQILDVQGRECSDFQAFSARSLDAGTPREIDPTATRTMTGTIYPRPGLAAKYWTVDLEPLVEIVQDTCGRHDTFGLACTSRYYDDMGYPGHVNCTDNINAGLDPYGVRPRGGWPAINFFFNTLIDADHGIVTEEPWSRPGDYVLLRAMTDLVCVSTACPDDIDPANGWNPTDIQLRTYGANEDFRRSIGWRKRPEDDVAHTQETGFHASFARHTRDFVEYNGYWLPNGFPGEGTLGEYWACREKVAIMDLSPLRKFEVTGPDAEALMQYCVTRNMEKLAVGQVVYTAVCSENGGMIDDGTVFRMSDHNFRWIGGCDGSGAFLREQAERLGLDAHVRSSTDQLCNVALQGRHSRAILSQVFWTAPDRPTVDELGWFRFTVARIGDFQGVPVVISRTGYTGELGYEVFCHPKDAGAVFDAIWEAGQPYGLKPLGLAALDILRIESGLAFAGHEFDDRTDPFEAGIGFTVPLKSKTCDFSGRAALEERKAHPQRRLVGLEIDATTVPAHGDCVRIGRQQVGVVTSATRSPILSKTIALARIDMPHAEIGAEVEVGQLDGHQKRLAARIVPFPHFDPTKARAKGDYGT
ncbi:MAG: aminomethyltransferase [Rhodobacteraceae bacterium]|jgi:aminomethyltransferase|uniref:Aminomethyltransferase n=2 Tax=Salipiger TaxID=263377 RepID=A0A1U7DC23_9RHOB|nr:aminomethyltransferase family protein [Salipiger profundus]APX25683.1 aminomethyltransferase [Salipiger profundus]MAB06362.1 aminomethyltransferase [Paracoccaceae bacterium]GGA04102.1 aminomethyltransferase [Salipiger profundus]SFD55335.1 aminomethyltransferase [Salipiger profundus]